MRSAKTVCRHTKRCSDGNVRAIPRLVRAILDHHGIAYTSQRGKRHHKIKTVLGGQTPCRFAVAAMQRVKP
jgi:hypothetical protein